MGCVYRAKRRKVWMLKYRDLSGKTHRESSGTTDKEAAKKLLRKKDHLTDQGVLVTPDVGKLKFSEAVTLLLDYHKARDRKTKKIEGRIAKHLTAYFGANRLMVTITGDRVMAYIAKRKADVTVLPERRKKTRKGWVTIPERRKTVRNATINRELAWLKQMFTLAMDAGKLMGRPKITMLPENNARQGFFEPEQFQAVLRNLPDDLRPPVQFAYITGWRIKSEVLTREWRHVDLKAGTVCLEPGEAKNKEPRTFVMTTELKSLLERQHAERERLKKRGLMSGFGSDPVFFRMVAEERGGAKKPQRVKSLTKAFKKACAQAGLPGRIPHDLRRSAVRRFVRHGIPDGVAMKMTGHKTRSVFERYNIVSDADLRDAAAKLDAAATTSEKAG